MDHPLLSLDEYIIQERKSSRGIPKPVIERWTSRIITEGFYKMGEAGAHNYLYKYGKNISEQKLIDLAIKAELEGYAELALGFWKKAYERSTKEFENNERYRYKKPYIRVLFLSANPIDTQKIRLDEEVRVIDQALRSSAFREKFDLQQQWAVRVSDLQSCLLRYKPDIVHFSGHGTISNEIILENEIGESHPVPIRALSILFSVLRDNIKCVVLNACYSEQQAHAISEHIKYVVGIRSAIRDKSAINFSMAFYQALGYGKDIKTAFELGNIQIGLGNYSEQAMPILLSKK